MRVCTFCGQLGQHDHAPMTDTPHIKRYEEYVGGPTVDISAPEKVVGAMLNDLAEHVERLEGKLNAIESLFRGAGVTFHGENHVWLAKLTDTTPSLKPKKVDLDRMDELARELHEMEVRLNDPEHRSRTGPDRSGNRPDDGIPQSSSEAPQTSAPQRDQAAEESP